MKKTILHIIQDLNRGGAENILVTTIKELCEYRNIVVTLFSGNQFKEEFRADMYYNLNMKHGLFFPFYVKKIRQIIKENKVDLVHSRLPYSNFLARLATPTNIPLVTTIHAYPSQTVEYKNKRMIFLDKLTYRVHKTYMMADSKGALEEYFSFLKLKPFKAISPYTFVDIRKFNDTVKVKDFPEDGIFRLVSVGRLTIQKNYQYLVEAFKYLRDCPIELHIYGSGPLYNHLFKAIVEHKLNIELKGLDVEINKKLGAYDAYVMSSIYEGFSLAVLEAMAMGLPLFLSDMPSFREQGADVAIYFDLSNPQNFAEKIKSIYKNNMRLEELGAKAKSRVLENFTLAHHMSIVRNFYAEALEDYQR